MNGWDYLARYLDSLALCGHRVGAFIATRGGWRCPTCNGHKP
jgi:hypothetical protein